ncbi:hypothetical protein N7471_010487 [Penicillium samsonianum]|uniref:uncharacterized protein n=1 Tax=Penicillium samsonianum TaxID=1882272 RepID=UPI0025487883|nr:uncharacterized protein N7471_010487 [Penicillium samsonianum]KAJ6125994.1 hypothetical protein N7471_010487 [Penicillium samsonianum]
MKRLERLVAIILCLLESDSRREMTEKFRAGKQRDNGYPKEKDADEKIYKRPGIILDAGGRQMAIRLTVKAGVFTATL